MITRFQFSVFSQPAAALFMALAAPFGGMLVMQTDENVAAAELAMGRWQAETTAALNRALADASAARLMTPNSAIVQVVFSVGADGKADKIKLIEGDGNWPARRAALYAIEQLDTLDRVPVANPLTVRFIANLVFYRSLDAKERLLARLREWERVRAASESADRFYLAIGNH